MCLVGTGLGLHVNVVDAAADMTAFPCHTYCDGAISLLASHQKAKRAQLEGVEAFLFIILFEMQGEVKKCTLSKADIKSQNVAGYFSQLKHLSNVLGHLKAP